MNVTSMMLGMATIYHHYKTVGSPLQREIFAFLFAIDAKKLKGSAIMIST
jgi:hypothetical protein